MSKLIQGQESEAKIDLLLSLTRINSVNKIDALKLHLVKGYPAVMAYELCDVKQQNFKSTLDALNRVYTIHEKLNELD
ncbi:hypothetical protein TUM4438_46230 [Shewanella sairae]|uniref:Uncharacterized protein n=1 Tax=Shewanella sairae TaxID=190310 RepID=A0ABQ4PS01_9GAMM|nr:adhesin biosynthesis transcription regulatory family protein [Shewanella sairae]MCL1132693.1 adhesin biosynthesis transcription regulatory family protein [Shewanella sairae]GIU52768.1 hypothetical protein TUM4438_46230 [Shewanella sairae]